MVSSHNFRVLLTFSLLMICSVLFHTASVWYNERKYYLPGFGPRHAIETFPRTNRSKENIIRNYYDNPSSRTFRGDDPTPIVESGSEKGDDTKPGQTSLIDAIDSSMDPTKWTARTLPISANHSGDKAILQVGFFEGFRWSWIYHRRFPSPEVPRICQCLHEGGSSFEVVATLESRANETGKFDILIFAHDVGVSPGIRNEWDKIISSASAKQRRVYATFEGAFKLHLIARKLPYRKRSFHWSWTYHSNSEFVIPYGSFKEFRRAGTPERAGKNWATGKTGLVAWMSTWKNTSWRRREFVEFLQKYLPIDLFGRRYEECPRFGDECEQIMRKYKFYLALENSCCGEYITEKLWRTLSWDIVPIVLGANRSEYERLAPPNSFIHLDDFESAREFADYVIFLSNNDAEYNKYFAWKSMGEVHVNFGNIPELPESEPSENYIYSCDSVCRVSRRYLLERTEEENSEETSRPLSNATVFDPNGDWWCGSCIQCGQQDWLREFN